jgi:hypothetical protein
MPRNALHEPFKVSLVDGEVVFLGGGLGFSMTPSAARQTWRRLLMALEREQRAGRAV